MKGDKAKHDITSISKLGLMEIARQRLKGEKMGATYATCVTCDGHGLLKTIEAAALAALRKIQTRSARGGFGRLIVGLPPEVAEWILNSKREEILGLEKRHGIQIVVEATPSLLRHECDFNALAAEPAAEPVAADREGRPAPAAAPDLPAAQAAPDRPAPAAPPVQEPASPPSDGPRTESPDKEGAETATTEGGEEAPRKRRRRRRRRKPRSGTGQEGSADSTEGSKPGSEPERAPEPAPEPVAVPEKVISNELMPAAVGAAEGQRNRQGRNGSRRKRG
jgi:ribonuclease E